MAKGNAKDNKIIYANVSKAAIGFTIVMLELYSNLEIDILSFFNASGALLYVLKIIAFALHWLIFTLIYQLAHHIATKHKISAWAKANAEINIAGTWLHIHDKESVRIGTVDIKQDFYDLEVTAENIHPQSNDDRITKWHYIGSEFKPDENAAIQLIGCYIAKRDAESTKQGVHLFREFTSENGVITKMTGEFGDALSIRAGHTPEDASDKVGKIHLFRMTDEIKEYIGFKSVDVYDREKLRWIISEKNIASIANSDYVKALKIIYYKNEFQKQWSELKRFYEKHFDKQIIESTEAAIYNMLAYAMFADNEVDALETETLRSLTGLSRSLADHPILKKQEVLSDIRKVLEELLPYDEGLRLLRLILCNSCRSIILCNSKQADQEKQFLEEIENEIKLVGQAQTC